MHLLKFFLLFVTFKLWNCEKLTDETYLVCKQDESDLCSCGNDYRNKFITSINCSYLKRRNDKIKPLTTTNINLDSNANFSINKSMLFRVIFDGNQIDAIYQKTLIPLMATNVDMLSFESNKISFIEEKAFDEITQLKVLVLRNNPIGVNVKNGWLTQILGQHLEFLDLHNCKITELPEFAFANFSRLQFLHLSNNPGLQLNENTFGNTIFDKMKDLFLMNCSLTTLPLDFLERFPNLRSLNLRNNHLTAIPRGFYLMPDLFNLHLNDKTPDLFNLDLSQNPIEEIPENAFDGFQNINTLTMSYMPNLTKINDCAFCGIVKMWAFYLDKNPRLSEIHENAFGYFNNDEKKTQKVSNFNLIDCNISVIDENLLNWQLVDSIHISGNPVNCVPEMDWLFKDKLYKYEDIYSGNYQSVEWCQNCLYNEYCNETIEWHRQMSLRSPPIQPLESVLLLIDEEADKIKLISIIVIICVLTLIFLLLMIFVCIIVKKRQKNVKIGRDKKAEEIVKNDVEMK